MPMEWEERWRREKERRKRVIEEGGEAIEQDNRELRNIVAFNDSRMGLSSGRDRKERSEVTRGSTSEEVVGADVSKEVFWDEGSEACLHTYRSETSPNEIFKALKELRDSSLLTDLTLTTEDGSSFHVHSPVLAAISSLILESLRERSQDLEDVGLDGCSLSLDAEVDHVGLQAVVEFAYTGVVFCLNKDTMAQIKTAAQLLGVPRLLDLCNKEEKIKEGGSTKKKERTISPLEQMKITLQSIEHLWIDRVGCDVILDVDGALFHG